MYRKEIHTLIGETYNPQSTKYNCSYLKVTIIIKYDKIAVEPA